MALSSPCGVNTHLFKSKIPDILLCKLCYLVVKSPVKIVTCGHLYCKECIHRYRMLSQKNQKQLVCPADHKDVEYHQIIYDEETESLIEDLAVNCPNKVRSCDWTGTFKDMESHFTTCERKDRMQEFFERVEKLEEKLVEKERDIAFLKNDKEVQVSHKLRTQMIEQKEINEQLKVQLYELTIRMEEVENKSKDEVNDEIDCTTTDQEITVVKEHPDSSNIITAIVVKRQQVYLEFSIENRPIGRIIINLFYNEALNTCRKFIQLVIDESGVGYKGTKIYRIGSSAIEIDALSSAKKCFLTPVENLEAKHDKKGLLTFVNKTSSKTKSNFAILYKETPHLDGKSVVFGQITEQSLCVVEEMLKVPREDLVKDTGKLRKKNVIPVKDITITDCGVLF